VINILVSLLKELVRHGLRFGVNIHLSGLLVIDPVLGDVRSGIYRGLIGVAKGDNI
jgi:hypothetical protein